MRRVSGGHVDRRCVWKEAKAERRPVFEPGGPRRRRPGSEPRDRRDRSIAALKAHATRWRQRAVAAVTEPEKAACLARAAGYQNRVKVLQEQYIA